MGNHQASGQNIRYCRVNCAFGPSKSIRYSGDFIIVGFVIARFVSTYFTVILLGFQIMFVTVGCHCHSPFFLSKIISEYYKRIEKNLYFDTSILCLRHAILLQRLFLPVKDWYKQCVCVGAWAKHGVCQQQKALQWR